MILLLILYVLDKINTIISSASSKTDEISRSTGEL